MRSRIATLGIALALALSSSFPAFADVGIGAALEDVATPQNTNPLSTDRLLVRTPGGPTKWLAGDFYRLLGNMTGTLGITHGGTGQTAAGGAMIDALSGFGFTGIVKRIGSASYGAAAAGTDFPALTTTVCGSTDKVSGINAATGVVTCSADVAGSGVTWNFTDTITPLTNVLAITTDPTWARLGGTAGAATFNPLCPQAAGTLGDASATIASGKIARITASLTAPRSYTFPAASTYPAGCRLMVVDEFRSVSGTNTATLLRAGSDTINKATTFPALTSTGFFAEFESDGSANWAQVASGVLGPLQNGQFFCGTSNVTAICTMSGDITLASGGALTIASSANVAKAPSNITNNALAKGDGAKNLSSSTVVDNGSGVTVGSPTGGPQGAGTINATGVYVNGVAAAAGGNVSNSGTPTANQQAVWVDATHIQGVAPVTAFMSTVGNMPTNTTRYAAPGSGLWNAAEIFTPVPRAMTLKSVSARAVTDPGSGQTIIVTVRKLPAGSSSADTAETCTITGNGTTNLSCTFATDISYAAGDGISFKAVTSASETASNLGVTVEFN